MATLPLSAAVRQDDAAPPSADPRRARAAWPAVPARPDPPAEEGSGRVPQPPRRRPHRDDLRQAVHPHAGQLRIGRLDARDAADRPPSRRAPARPRRDDRRHRPRPVALSRRPDRPDVRAGHGRGAVSRRVDPGDQRPDQRAPPVPGDGRRHDPRGDVRGAGRPSSRVHRRRRQRLPLADPGRRPDRFRAPYRDADPATSRRRRSSRTRAASPRRPAARSP